MVELTVSESLPSFVEQRICLTPRSVFAVVHAYSQHSRPSNSLFASKSAPEAMKHAGERNIQWIEVGRTVAMGLVIVVHSVDNVLSGPYMPGLSLCISVLACMAVPAFFIISGYLAGMRPGIEPV